jgi:hypothetical protein
MSLEAKLAELKIDDASSIVEQVKKEGALKSGLVAGLEVLKARCDSSDADDALAALKTTKMLVEECPEVQAFTKECLTACKYRTIDIICFIARWSFFEMLSVMNEVA